MVAGLAALLMGSWHVITHRPVPAFSGLSATSAPTP